MSVKHLQFIELEQTCTEYGLSNASCFNVFSSIENTLYRCMYIVQDLFQMGINFVLL